MNISFLLYNSSGVVNLTTFSLLDVSANGRNTSFNFTSFIVNGNYTYNISVTDFAGNVNWTATRTLTIDTIAPVTYFNTTMIANATNLSIIPYGFN